jgi:hypothetical protein
MVMKNTLIKKNLILNTLLVFIVIPLLASVTLACNLDAELINQDPYPALSGDYVEVLFQINGIGSDCEDGAIAELILEYPFSLDGKDSSRILKSSTYAGYGHSSYWNLLYKIRIDPNTIEDDYEVELRYSDGNSLYGGSYIFEKFNITVEDGRTDFEIYVDDYKISDRNLVLEILNVGNQDIEALTVEIPKQDNIVVKGSNRNIVGDLDSNEYTTADFEAIPSEGDITINLIYTDSTNERRSIQKTVYYDPTYFVDSLDNTAPDKTATYVVAGIIIIAIVYFFFRRHKKKKHKKKNKFEV